MVDSKKRPRKNPREVQRRVWLGMAVTRARRREGNMCRWEAASFISEKEERFLGM
jgi:hypothetical protein